MTTREDRFDVLYTRHYRAIYDYVYRRLPSHPGEVPDVTAEVFTVAWRRLDSVPVGTAALPWLYRVAFRCVQRARRTHARRSRLVGRLTDETQVDRSAATAEPPAREDEVRAAVDRLRPRDREVLRLVLWDGLSHADAAVVLGCSANAVAQRLHTARERLRAELTPTPSGAPGMSTTT